MAEEIDDNHFFREDFSTESEWEEFNAQLDEIFRRWELSDTNWDKPLEHSELFNCEWSIQSDTLELLKKEILVEYYAVKHRPFKTSSPKAGSKKSVEGEATKLPSTSQAPDLSNSQLLKMLTNKNLRDYVLMPLLDDEIIAPFLRNELIALASEFLSGTIQAPTQDPHNIFDMINWEIFEERALNKLLTGRDAPPTFLPKVRVLVESWLKNEDNEKESVVNEVDNEPVASISLRHRRRTSEDRDTVNQRKSEELPPFHVDLLSLQNTFGPPLEGMQSSLHPLARFYGLRRFVLLRPLYNQTQYLTNPAEFSYFLSTISMLCAEVCSAVPIFVQIFDPKWNFFVGVGMAPSLRTNFDLIALEQSPVNYRHLSGLLNIFKDKLPTTYLEPAKVSIRTIYSFKTISLPSFVHIPYAHVPPEAEAPMRENPDWFLSLNSSELLCLPYGYFPDACVEMFLVYTWPEIAENIAIDSALRSDFVPAKAVCGSLHQVTHATSFLSSCLRDYLKLRNCKHSLETVLGRNFTDYKKMPSGPMKEKQLDHMVSFLVPDSSPAFMASFSYTEEYNEIKLEPHRIKSIMPGSFVARLSSLLAIANAHWSGKSGVAQLWASVILSVQSHLFKRTLLPGVASGHPDLHTCLLHQKLQMINSCIRCRTEGGFFSKLDGNFKPDPTKKANATSSDEDDDKEDEFFDCESNLIEPELTEQETGAGDAKSYTTGAVECLENVGIRKPFGDLKLLDDENEPLYVPVTQEPVPKTEDQLFEDSENMLKLGPDSGLTTRMMSSSLRSDMEAFKAANPKGKMEDFIRWYSPKDWIESTDEEGKLVGNLSARMSTPDNTWQMLWKKARPMPAYLQKRLFDEEKEAFDVLKYLETRTFADIFELTIVPLLHTAVLKVKEMFINMDLYDVFADEFDEIAGDLSRLSRDVKIVSDPEFGFITETADPEHIIKKLELLESHYYHYQCFQYYLSTRQLTALVPSEAAVKKQFMEIVQNGGGWTLDSKRISIILEKEGLSKDYLDTLVSKEYVIRAGGETTTPERGPAGPQFLRAIVTGEKIRLCGAFTENTTFL